MTDFPHIKDDAAETAALASQHADLVRAEVNRRNGGAEIFELEK